MVRMHAEASPFPLEGEGGHAKRGRERVSARAELAMGRLS
jgi:hypothetical protein